MITTDTRSVTLMSLLTFHYEKWFLECKITPYIFDIILIVLTFLVVVSS